jgi:hypothetical protein
MHEDKEMMARRIGQRGREEVELHLLVVTTPACLARASCGQRAPQRPQEGVLGRRGERCELREWLESSFYRRGRQREGEPAVVLPNGWQGVRWRWPMEALVVT